MHVLNELTKGVFVISLTPFDDRGEIDYPSLDRLIEFYLEQGAHGLTVLGMMGEAHKMTAAEAEALTRRFLARVAGRVPVVVGVSSASLVAMRQLSHLAMEQGAAGVMVAPIAGLRTDDQLLGYYASVLDALGPAVPVVYQDYPQSTGVFLSVGVFNRMVRAFPQLVMLKMEDCPGLGKLSGVRRTAAQDGLRRVSILVGNGGFYFPQALARGADGVMTGFAYPDMLVRVYDRFVAGDRQGAEDLFDTFLPLVYYEQQPGYGLAVRKEILRRRGAIASALVRAPGASLTADDVLELDALMARLERRLSEAEIAPQEGMRTWT
jgi:4-hydroxy-tetrahydrodipicolinate synthase